MSGLSREIAGIAIGVGALAALYLWYAMPDYLRKMAEADPGNKPGTANAWLRWGVPAGVLLVSSIVYMIFDPGY